jgi:hypothetical protein
MAKINSGAADQQRREHWRRLLARWQSSGLSQAAFCRRERIHVWQFTWWKKRLGADGVIRPVRHPQRSREIAPTGIAPNPTIPTGGQVAGRHDLQFVPVQVVASPAASDLELTLRGGQVLRFGVDVEAAKLVKIVAALESGTC